MKITIDARKIHDSGVGTYIQNLVPKIVDGLPEHHFTLLGNREELTPYFNGRSQLKLVDYHTRP